MVLHSEKKNYTCILILVQNKLNLHFYISVHKFTVSSAKLVLWEEIFIFAYLNLNFYICHFHPVEKKEKFTCRIMFSNAHCSDSETQNLYVSTDLGLHICQSHPVDTCAVKHSDLFCTVE